MSTMLLALLFFLVTPSLSAQRAPMKWGKVSKTDLAMTEYAQDTSASAVVLCNFGELDIVFEPRDIMFSFF